jgi:hypothetical protein
MRSSSQVLTVRMLICIVVRDIVWVRVCPRNALTVCYMWTECLKRRETKRQYWSRNPREYIFGELGRLGQEKNRSHGYCCSESSQSLCVYMKVVRLLHGVELVICRSVLSMWLDPKSIAKEMRNSKEYYRRGWIKKSQPRS